MEDEQHVEDNILANLRLPDCTFRQLPLHLQRRVEAFFKELLPLPPCPLCHTTDHVRFRFFNNPNKSKKILQPRYLCTACGSGGATSSTAAATHIHEAGRRRSSHGYFTLNHQTYITHLHLHGGPSTLLHGTTGQIRTTNRRVHQSRAKPYSSESNIFARSPTISSELHTLGLCMPPAPDHAVSLYSSSCATPLLGTAGNMACTHTTARAQHAITTNDTGNAAIELEDTLQFLDMIVDNDISAHDPALPHDDHSPQTLPTVDSSPHIVASDQNYDHMSSGDNKDNDRVVDSALQQAVSDDDWWMQQAPTEPASQLKELWPEPSLEELWAELNVDVAHDGLPELGGYDINAEALVPSSCTDKMVVDENNDDLLLQTPIFDSCNNTQDWHHVSTRSSVPPPEEGPNHHLQLEQPSTAPALQVRDDQYDIRGVMEAIPLKDMTIIGMQAPIIFDEDDDDVWLQDAPVICAY